MTETSQQVQSTERADTDLYPTVAEGLTRILQEGTFEEGRISKLEVNFLANGEATYKYWMRELEEPEGGVLAAPPSS